MDDGLNSSYSEFRSDFLNATERLLVSQLLDKDKLEKASLNNVAYAFGQVHNARRLEQNLSTANVSSKLQVRDMAPEEKEKLDQALESIYGSSGTVVAKDVKSAKEMTQEMSYNSENESDNE